MEWRHGCREGMLPAHKHQRMTCVVDGGCGDPDGMATCEAKGRMGEFGDGIVISDAE